MTLVQLTYLVAVDTQRHFGRAAEQCFVTQPALSMQIRKLEEELGVMLFDRSASPIRPTDIGERVIAQARVVLAEEERLRALMEEERGEVAGELRLGIIPTVASALLPIVASEVAERHPRMLLTVHELTTARVLEALERDQIDAGLIATPELRSGLVSDELYDEPFVGYVSDGHRLSRRRRIRPEDLDRDELWLLSEGHCFRDQVLQLCSGGRAESPERPLLLESGNLETVCRLVDRVGGLTLLPYLETAHMGPESRARVRPFAGRAPTRGVRLVSRLAYAKRPLQRALATVIVEKVRELLPA